MTQPGRDFHEEGRPFADDDEELERTRAMRIEPDHREPETRTIPRTPRSQDDTPLSDTPDTPHPSGRLQHVSDTSAKLKFTQLQLEAALRTPPEKRSTPQIKLVRHHELEQFALSHPFVAGIEDQKLRIRQWGVALEREGSEENRGTEIGIPHATGTLQEKNIWVVPLDPSRYKRWEYKDIECVECSWTVVQRNGTGEPKWLYFSVSKNRRLKFHALEIRLDTGSMREMIMVDVTNAVYQTKRSNKVLPITLIPPGDNTNNGAPKAIGDYVVRNRYKKKQDGTKVWTVTLNTFAPMFRPEIPLEEILDSG